MPYVVSDSEAERQQHPQIKKIPYSIWTSSLKGFKARLDESLLALMQEPDTYRAVIMAYRNRAQTQWLKEQQWLCIALSHPDDPILLIQLARDVLELSTDNMLQLCAMIGAFEMLEYIVDVPPEEKQRLISGDNFLAFSLACTHGQEKIATWLLEEVDETRKQSMIAAAEYGTFANACKFGHQNIARLLLDQVCPENREAMMSTLNALAFSSAYESHHEDIANWLLSQSVGCFAYAEEHFEEYQEMVNSYINQQLSFLHKEQQFWQKNNNEKFDLTEEKDITICFYILRNLIRQNDRGKDDEIRFLLGIPSVKALAHQEVTPGKPNELLRLAQKLGHHEATALLLQIPEVYALAEANDFYREETQKEADLKALTANPESAMLNLSEGEQMRLKGLINQYEPLLLNKGEQSVLDELRHFLLRRYQENPATIMVNDKKIILPHDFESFQQLSLDDDARQEALKAYYRHEDHTAWRYLSKPNLWMHPEASYVVVDEQNPAHRYADFENYQSLIGIFYLAAKDENTPPTNKHTLETRISHFVHTLALMGRTHNWDKTRIRNGKKEEYDDLEGDRPTCLSGIKQYLFSSVVGHPLTDILTLTRIKHEFRNYIREHFKKIVKQNGPEIYRKAFEQYVTELEFNPCLKELDLTEEDKNTFISEMKKKYGLQFESDPVFTIYIEKKLSLKDKQGNVIDHAHVLKLDEDTQFYNNVLAGSSVKASDTATLGFFSAAKKEPPASEGEEIHENITKK